MQPLIFLARAATSDIIKTDALLPKEVASRRCPVIPFLSIRGGGGGVMAAVSNVVAIAGELVVVRDVVERRRRKIRRHRHRSKRHRCMVGVAAHQHLRVHDPLTAAGTAISRERACAGGAVEGAAGVTGHRRRAVLHHCLLDDGLMHALRRLGLDPPERGESGEEVRHPRAAHVVAVRHAGRARCRVQRLPPARLCRDGLVQALFLSLELLQDRLVHHLAAWRGGGGRVEVAVDNGIHGGVAERVGLLGAGEHDDGDVRTAEHGELGGLLEEAAAALGEAHVPRRAALDALDLDLLPPQRLLPLPLFPAGLAAAPLRLLRHLHLGMIAQWR
jgi:hypothetical protein